MRNRIINGAQVIDQRNAGASFTPTNGAYTLDRWAGGLTQASKYTVQQTPSTTESGYATRVAAGFSNYLAATVGASANVTVGSTDYFYLQQPIEGYNTADLAWGTANAKPITLSFWVYSSVTGTYGGSLKSTGSGRSYPFTYTISSASTWSQISITIAGDTSGTWNTTNGIGINLTFGLGVGSNFTGSAGAWASANYLSATGAGNWISTNSATFYITGVQLEAGTTASPFEYRQYGTELQLCQRYYQQYNGNAAQGSGASWFPFMVAYSTGAAQGGFTLPVPMRASPTVSYTGTFKLEDGSAGYTSTNAIAQNCTPYAISVWLNGFTGLRQWYGYYSYAGTTASSLNITAEL
jgi:hypothetical protein